MNIISVMDRNVLLESTNTHTLLSGSNLLLLHRQRILVTHTHPTQWFHYAEKDIKYDRQSPLGPSHAVEQPHMLDQGPGDLCGLYGSPWFREDPTAVYPLIGHSGRPGTIATHTQFTYI